MNLILGGAGYIGSHTVKRLKRRGEEVLVYDDLSQGHRAAVGQIPLVVGDVNDTDKLCRVMTEHHVDSVIHFAAFCYVGESVKVPGKYYHNNVSGMVSVLNAMVAAKVPRIIFSSSAATYGVPEKGPIREDAPLNPINPYGRTKLMMEQMMADYETAHGISYTALRYFNAAGADAEGELGEWHDPETHLIPLAIYAALGLKKNVTLFGDQYDTPDGFCVRDFIHVDDLAEAHILALDRLRDGGKSRPFNLGNGQGYSVKEVAEKVREVSGREFEVKIGPARPGDPPSLVADARLAERELHWKQAHPSLDEIVTTAYRWLERHPAGY
ncbi:MAG: UDP-glucose 4-epimerase GalE [Planctomycetes bacterium]|nr:UDP-glucose 4-epimerase GalE [Planctomycetota bacterium]